MDNITRIAHVIGNITKAGVESVVFNYYRYIDKSKIQFDFIIHDDSPYEIPEDIINLGCKVYKVPPYKKLPKYIKALKNIFITGNYKIVHSHMSTLSVFTLYAAKLAKVPVRISHSHATAGKGKGEFLRNILKYILRLFSKKYATHYFACSKLAGKWLFGNKAFKNGKITVLNNAIDPKRYIFNEQIRKKTRDKLNISDKFVLGHVGRFMPQKNHNFLIDIFSEVYKKNKNSILLLIGDGELKNKIIKKAEKLKLLNNIMFLGARDDVNELYQAMDVFILPSLYEGLPVVLVETQIAGLPSIISDKVTEETKFSDIVYFMNLNQKPLEWANEILKNTNKKRINTANDERAKKYYITEEANILNNIYYQMIGQNI